VNVQRYEVCCFCRAVLKAFDVLAIGWSVEDVSLASATTTPTLAILTPENVMSVVISLLRSNNVFIVLFVRSS